MWRVIKVCPKCLSSSFDKDEDSVLACIECGDINEVDDLIDMVVEE